VGAGGNSCAISARCRFIVALLHQGRISPAGLPFVRDCVRRCKSNAFGREARRALRRTILFFCSMHFARPPDFNRIAGREGRSDLVHLCSEAVLFKGIILFRFLSTMAGPRGKFLVSAGRNLRLSVCFETSARHFSNSHRQRPMIPQRTTPWMPASVASP
jgi:hypothetical protein